MRFSLVIVVARVFINARFSSRFSFLHFLLFSCVFIFISFLVCSESEKEMGRDRSPKDPGRSSSLDEVERMFSVCCRGSLGERRICSSCRCVFLLVRASFPHSFFVSFFSSIFLRV